MNCPQDADSYIEEINKMSIQLKDFEVKEGVAMDENGTGNELPANNEEGKGASILCDFSFCKIVN